MLFSFVAEKGILRQEEGLVVHEEGTRPGHVRRIATQQIRRPRASGLAQRASTRDPLRT
jgi:hypothetical protein